MSSLLAWAPAFTSRRHEALFQRLQSEASCRHDCSFGCLAFTLWCLSLLRFRTYLSLLAQLRYLASGTVALVPWFICHVLGARTYSRHRLLIITAVRLGTACLPTLADAVFSLRTPTSLRDFMVSLPVVMRLPKLILVALGFRLPFFLHCLVQSIQLTVFLGDVPPLCGTAYFQSASSAHYFNNTAALLSIAGSMFAQHPGAEGVVAGTGNGAASASAIRGQAAQQQQQEQQQQQQLVMDAQCGCTAMLWALMVVLGFVLPTFAVLLLEKLGRAVFMASRWHDRGWHASDIKTHLLFDWLALVLRFVCLLPLLLSAAWHLAIVAAAWTGNCQPLAD